MPSIPSPLFSPTRCPSSSLHPSDCRLRQRCLTNGSVAKQPSCRYVRGVCSKLGFMERGGRGFQDLAMCSLAAPSHTFPLLLLQPQKLLTVLNTEISPQPQVRPIQHCSAAALRLFLLSGYWRWPASAALGFTPEVDGG